MRIAETLPDNAVVVEEALTSSFSLPSFLRFRDAQGYHGLASGGIGFAMAGAVGISLGLPDRPVVAIVGDGSAMYTIQALWTAAHLKLPITYLIPNNRSYRILKERLTARSGQNQFVGMDLIVFQHVEHEQARRSVELTRDQMPERPAAGLARELGARVVDRRIPVSLLNLLWHRAGWPHCYGR